MPTIKKNEFHFENEVILIKENILTVKSSKVGVVLSKNQSIFLRCLLQGCTNKKNIIKKIWPDCEHEQKDNNYRQLLFQTRTLLRNSGLDNSLLRVSKNTLCLDMNLLSPIIEKNKADIMIHNDRGLFYITE
ncbi:hypothetical protein [Serratia marcescens]|uniref:OmpR/PhoB-type domain-containing protein n=1 Tax=Serratia marcescens TaxID=615 RepID=A0ABD6I1P4_SERMA|nr:hypothetical protein [Serratia marcescens]MDT0204226.1 hypothetical protein [Serratia marcescens]MVF04954.1 hypothetical protein [Serratia marcescens]